MTTEGDYSENEATVYSSSVGIVVVTTIIPNVVNSFSGGLSSGQGASSGMLVLQSIVILPYLGTSVPPLVGKSMSNMKDSMVSFSFVPNSAVPYYSSLNSRFSSKRYLSFDDEYSITESESSFINLLKLLIVILVIIPVCKLISVLVTKAISKAKDSWVKKAIQKLNHSLGVSFCVRFLMLVYTFLMITSFPEANDWIRGEEGNSASQLFAILIFVL